MGNNKLNSILQNNNPTYEELNQILKHYSNENLKALIKQTQKSFWGSAGKYSNHKFKDKIFNAAKRIQTLRKINAIQKKQAKGLTPTQQAEIQRYRNSHPAVGSLKNPWSPTGNPFS